VTVNVLSLPLPNPVPGPEFTEVRVGAIVVAPQVPAVVQVTVTGLGTVKVGVVPLVQR
jgi:hypothetical protein